MMSQNTIQIYIDEAGRWPLAGPVVVGCVIVLQDTDTSQYRDSKQLSESERNRIYKKIKSDPCLITSVGSSSESLIDRNGIVWALRSAIIQAIKKIYHKLYKQSAFLWSFIDFKQTCHIMLDGNTDFWLYVGTGIPVTTIIKGDQLVPFISAASILAKTIRDRFMITKSYQYPDYGFAQHKWYGTLAHRKAIVVYGLCPLHRKTFCRGVMGLVV